MVFMEDSERAAAISLENGIDAGLHLNFTTTFSAKDCPTSLVGHQRKVAEHLLRHRFGRAIYHPGLAESFKYVFNHQVEEFRRLYGKFPQRLDGHHHMHLCANILVAKLLPTGTIVRRSESFLASEKGLMNRLYRRMLDKVVSRRHHVADYFFTLGPLEPPARLQRIFQLGRQFVVELETHPVNGDEYRFLTSGEVLAQIGNIPIAQRYELAEAISGF